MDGGFLVTYADILYRAAVVGRALDHPGDAVLCVDTQWRERYADRSQHPEDDAEKVLAEGDRVLRVSRKLLSSETCGEYIGVARFSAVAASTLRRHYHQLKARFDGQVWQEGTPFRRAYLIHLYQHMLEKGRKVSHGDHARRIRGSRHRRGLRPGQRKLAPEVRLMPTLVERCGTLFPTSVVGSLPRPDYVREIVVDGRRDEGWKGRLDAAVAHAVSLQEAAGLDVISDGEWRRASYIGVIAELADGFEVSQTEDGRPWTVVTGEVSVRNQGVAAAEVEYLRSLTERLIKVALPSPALLAERMWDADHSLEAYGTPRDFAEAVAPILRREAELVVEAGADIVQVDDPHLCLLVDSEVRAHYDEEDWGADEEAAFSVDMDNEVLVGIAGEAVRAVHLCRRAGARVRGEAYHSGGYGPIVPALGELDTDHLTLEFTNPGAGDVEVFEQLPEHLEIGLGCVGVGPGEIDDPARIVERVEQAVEVIGAERIVLNPDCGFAPGSAARSRPRRGLPQAAIPGRGGAAAQADPRLNDNRPRPWPPCQNRRRPSGS